MTTQALTVPDLSLSETMSLGEVLAKSGYFSDAKETAQAVVKVLAGREIGFGPIASMTGVHIIQGKPSIGANLIAAKVKGHPHYDYRVREQTEQVCTIEFFETVGGNRESLGVSTFTMEDAKTAGLTGKDNWKKYARNLLFARAISNGARWYCPDVFSGVTVYTPEEMGAGDTDHNGDIIDVTPTKVEAPPQSPPDDQDEYITPELIDEGELEPPPAPAPRYNSPDDRAKAMFNWVNHKTGGFFNSLSGLMKAIQTEMGNGDWKWPPLNDDAAWTKAANLALAYAEKNRG